MRRLVYSIQTASTNNNDTDLGLTEKSATVQQVVPDGQPGQAVTASPQSTVAFQPVPYTSQKSRSNSSLNQLSVGTDPNGGGPGPGGGGESLAAKRLQSVFARVIGDRKDQTSSATFHPRTRSMSSRNMSPALRMAADSTGLYGGSETDLAHPSPTCLTYAGIAKKSHFDIMADVTRALAKSEHLCQELRDENDDLRDEIKQLEAELDELQDSLGSKGGLKNELAETKGQLRDATKYIRVLQLKLRKAQRKIEELETEKMKLKAGQGSHAGSRDPEKATGEGQKSEQNLSIGRSNRSSVRSGVTSSQQSYNWRNNINFGNGNISLGQGIHNQPDGLTGSSGGRRSPGVKPPSFHYPVARKSSSQIAKGMSRSCSFWIRRIIEHFLFRAFSALIIAIDFMVILADILMPTTVNRTPLDITQFVFVMYFVVEIVLRIYVVGPGHFFKRWYNTIDFLAVGTCLVVSIILAVELSVLDYRVKYVIFGRLIRLVGLIRLFCTEPYNLKRSLQLMASGNRRRYRSREFDLDLTYVTPRIIAMSLPATGRMALYRNDLDEVVKFLDTMHGNHYRVYNLCAEKSYDKWKFHGQVMSIPVEFRQVPTLEQIRDFCQDVHCWLTQDEKNVIVVHCRDGNGRTAVMICSWLILTKQVPDATRAIKVFTDRRTDYMLGCKSQGVQTPSQLRYIEYWADVIKFNQGLMPAMMHIRLKSIRIVGINGMGRGDGSDFQIGCLINWQTSYYMDLGRGYNCSLSYEVLTDYLNNQTSHVPLSAMSLMSASQQADSILGGGSGPLLNRSNSTSVTSVVVTPHHKCPLLCGDVQMKFKCSLKSVPHGQGDCAFYFWFNTSFVVPDTRGAVSSSKTKLATMEEGQMMNASSVQSSVASSSTAATDQQQQKVQYRLFLPRDQLDNLHKRRAKKFYPDHFSIELLFEAPD